MTEIEDTPTHRVHILQAKMQQIVEWTQLLQTHRSVIVEKVVRAKANSKIARELTVNRSLERTLAKILRNLSKAEDLLNKVADDTNKARALFLEASDYEVKLERIEGVHGNHAESETDRGTVSTSADRSEDHSSAVHAGGAPESAARTNLPASDQLQSDAGPSSATD